MRVGKIILLVTLSILFVMFQNFTLAPMRGPDFARNVIDEPRIVFVEDFGAIGNDDKDDTFAIQKAIDHAFKIKAQQLVFQPKSYLLSLDHTLNTIVIFGENLTIEGNGATLTKSSPTGGNFGDTISISGLRTKVTYPVIGTYTGNYRPSKNIILRNLNIKHDLTKIKSDGMNCIGIVHATDVLLQNIVCENSPQSSFVAISYFEKGVIFKTEKVVWDNTHSINSVNHAYRVSSFYMDPSKDESLQDHSIDVSIKNCSSSGVREVNKKEAYKDILNHKVNLWYRPGYGNARLVVSNCKFDENGEVAITSAKVGSIEMINNSINGGIRVKNIQTKIKIEKNKIQCAYPIGSGAVFLQGMGPQDTFIHNLLYNYVEGCVDKSKNIGRFEDYSNSIIRLESPIPQLQPNAFSDEKRGF